MSDGNRFTTILRSYFRLLFWPFVGIVCSTWNNGRNAAHHIRTLGQANSTCGIICEVVEGLLVSVRRAPAPYFAPLIGAFHGIRQSGPNGWCASYEK